MVIARCYGSLRLQKSDFNANSFQSESILRKGKVGHKHFISARFSKIVSQIESVPNFSCISILVMGACNVI